MLGANQMGVTNGEKMNLQVGGPTSTIVIVKRNNLSHSEAIQVLAELYPKRPILGRYSIDL